MNSVVSSFACWRKALQSLIKLLPQMLCYSAYQQQQESKLYDGMLGERKLRVLETSYLLSCLCLCLTHKEKERQSMNIKISCAYIVLIVTMNRWGRCEAKGIVDKSYWTQPSLINDLFLRAQFAFPFELRQTRKLLFNRLQSLLNPIKGLS